MLLFFGTLRAQESTLQQANRQFDSQAYARAISLYEQATEEGKLTEAQRRTIKLNMAYSYYQLGDNPKAEVFYRDFFSEAPVNAGPLAIHYLHYAKVLGNNNKTTESNQQLAIYERLKREEQSKNSNTSNRKASYKVEYLALNTAESEFSPTYFKDGMVYVSGKMAAVSSESLKQGNMDLFYINNRNEIKLAKTINADGTETAVKNRTNSKSQIEPYRRLGKDTYTQSTSNDSRSVGVFNGYGLEDSPSNNGGGGASSKPGKPSSFSKNLNTKYHEGPATFSADGSYVIFTRNNFNQGQKGQSSENDVKLKLYSAQFGNGDWENVEELPFNSDEYSTAHPALSKDGSRLYFVSDMPGGVGGKDLYVSLQSRNGWGKPINLGKEINSRSDELFPFVDDNGNLYFSASGRRGSLGGLDIYYAVLNRDGTKVIDIMPLDAPINSKEDDFGIVTNSDRSVGFFSSDRRAGDDDIYKFTKENTSYDCRELTLRIYDSESSLPLDSATIIVKYRGSAESKELFTDENGRAHLCLLADNDFMFTAEKRGFLNSTIGFSTKGLTDDRPTRLEMSLAKPIMMMDTVIVEPEKKSEPDNDSEINPSTNSKKIGKSKKTEKTQDDGWDKADLKKIRTQMSVSGEVKGEIDGKPIEGAIMRLVDNCTGKAVQTVTSGKDGKYEFNVKTDNSCSYSVISTKKSYSTFVKKINRLPKKASQKVVTEVITMLKEGDMIRVNNINFDNSKADILPDAGRELNKLAGTMKKYPSVKFEILSHTDSRGEADANKAISQKRAQKIADYLVSKGIGRSRMKPMGMGESQPINGCVDGVICTEGEYQRNRRVEFKVSGD